MRILKPKITERENTGGSISYCVDAGVIDGKRRRRFFPTKAAAKEYADKVQEAKIKQGALAFTLSCEQQIEAKQAFDRLKAFDATLSQAIDFFLKHAKPKNGTKAASLVAAEFIRTREMAGKKPRYIRALKFAFGKFNKTFGSRNISEIQKAEVEGWLHTQSFTPQTTRNYLRDLGMLFKFAVDEGYAAENDVKRIRRPSVLDKPAEIFSVSEVMRLLFAAHQFDAELVPYIAIGLFAGLRSSELEALDWDEVRLERRHIEVKAAKAKTSQRRFVSISDNLYSWLKPYEQMDGPLVTAGWRDRLQKVAKHAGFERWPKNVLRHSFGSYHLAKHQDAAKTALQMGHEGTKMLFAHYRELVTLEQAAQYWKISPPEGFLMLTPQPENPGKAKVELLNQIIATAEEKLAQIA